MAKRLQDQHEALRKAVGDPEVCVQYLPGARIYGVLLLEDAIWLEVPNSDRFTRSQFARLYDFDYCPWSGRLMPGGLDHARNRVLRKEFGISDLNPFDPYDHVPPGFVNDEAWWVDRNIDIKRRPRQGRRSWKSKPYTVRYHDLFDCDPDPGLWRAREAPPHLCHPMSRVFDDIRYMITYIPWTREYGFRRLAVDRTIDLQPIRMMKFDYCPWCGTKLPDSLKARWLEEIKAAGHDPNDEALPQTFLSDTWWRQLGL